MKREVCFLIDFEGRILYADTSHSASRLEDSRQRWQIIWQYRETLAEITHSHPKGFDQFSTEDLTTFEALESALGRTLNFSIVTDTKMIRKQGVKINEVEHEPWWSCLLRLASAIDNT